MGFEAIAWDKVQAKCDELAQKLASPSLGSHERASLREQYARLAQLLELHGRFVQLDKEVADVRHELEHAEEGEMADLFRQELEEVQSKRSRVADELDHHLYPPDQIDNRSVFLEIRAGTGGQEAALFAADMLKMYTLYAERNGWKTSIASASETELGGYREIILHVQGKGVYGHLKNEAGVHRVQRVPKTETGGRVHTSTATVAVLPEAKEVDVEIDPSDLRVDVFRASGAGGQHVNTTDSAVRITHEPTGVIVSCQDERSQHKNRTKAMKMLRSRLVAAEQQRQQAEETQMRKQMVGAGERAEKVRTYNFPQNRVTDHQVNVTLKKLDLVMQGELDEIIQALMQKDRDQRRAEGAQILT